MTVPSTTEVRALVRAVLAELEMGADSGPASRTAPGPALQVDAAPKPAASPIGETVSEHRAGSAEDVVIDVADPTSTEARKHVGVQHPINESGLRNLVASTTARVGVGHAGPRPRTRDLLLFQADHAVTQDAIFGDVPTAMLEQLGLFVVETQTNDEEEYLLRPDLGRRLSEEGRRLLEDRCEKEPAVQIIVGDGLSAAAVTNNLEKIYPVIEQGLKSAGLSMGTPFFIRRCRVGVMNDVNEVIGADVVVLLIGERPGLGVADALSVYSGWRPKLGKSDAHRDVICMITEHGGTNPMEAGAYVVEHVQNVIAHQASGIELRAKRREEGDA